ncbi:hypothetical protein RND81_07G165900 [Saponaria officinalis]|uniref:CASP-like protein n=1 Tax=Saponaria officinalis TaxID=3572 RepID=A0AAW1JUV2_SAPOF
MANDEAGVKKPVFNYSALSSTVMGNKDTLAGLLRLLGVFATLSATIVMALNKETKTIVVATIGTTSIKATLTAKFQDNPANIFFVVANGLATVHNILALALCVFGKKLDRKGLCFTFISIFDIINVGILAAGASSAAFMADLAKHGNSHAAWNKVCDKFETFCAHGAGALLASFIGLAILLIVTLVSNIRLLQIANKTSAPTPV